MNEIDWSKAPDGSTHWDPMDRNHLRQAEGFSQVWNLASGWEPKSWQYPDDLSTMSRLIARPVWDGKDLPPVGTVCELWPRPSVDKTAVDHDRYKSQIGREVKIIAYHDIGGGCIAAVFAGENDFVFEYHSMIEGNFRPIRTAEQIAAEERTKAIDDLVKVTCINRGEAALIYDAGYRKQVHP